ncbi:RHS repeat domain-containing protein [Lewinella sp. LCG006]|uniref:RHS repeat domain-containing protein n=1 Tax=Lewinella sp. LCG006 TaxID=3231911 RepID=UPI003460C885
MIVEAGTLDLCNDGKQNGDEEGIDCGGSQCEPCVKLFVRGDKRYEITNHLGNVMAVITDERYLVSGNPGTVGVGSAIYATTPIRTMDYYPFGLEMNKPDTDFGEFAGYRFGFNGKEADSDKEWGSATHYDYGFRIYNPSIGKFLSVDPLAPSYPWYTPYQFAGNMPIQAIDIDGLEPGFSYYPSNLPKPKLYSGSEVDIYRIAATNVFTCVGGDFVYSDYVNIREAEEKVVYFFSSPIFKHSKGAEAEAAEDEIKSLVFNGLFSSNPHDNRKAINDIDRSSSFLWNTPIASFADVLVPSKATINAFKAVYGRISVDLMGGLLVH